MEPLGPRKGTLGMCADPLPHADRDDLDHAIARGGPRDGAVLGLA
jgi:hypothetical protein